MERGSTLFLRGAVLALGAIVLGLCIFALPAGIRAEDAGGYRPILWGMYVPVVPFFGAIYEAMKLLGYVDSKKAFSDLSVKTLGNIKYCALVVSGLFVAGMPYIYMVADQDDAPGVIVIGLVFAFVPLIVATFAAVLQRILQDAIAIKAENDLTV